MYTKHGHHIRGTINYGKRPERVARCGGPGLCPNCSIESTIFLNDSVDKGMTVETSMDFQLKAQLLVAQYFNRKVEKTDQMLITTDDVYVVWFSKTLQNWKALLSTTVVDGMYYEVTYNGDAKEVYLDAYKKFDNVCIPD